MHPDSGKADALCLPFRLFPRWLRTHTMDAFHGLRSTGMQI